MPERIYPDRQPKSQQAGEPPENLPVADFDTTPVEAVVAELREVRVPETAQQFVAASLSAVEAVLSDNDIVRNSRAFGIATRLAQRLEEYVVASSDLTQDEAGQQHTPARTPSLFAQGLFDRSNNPTIATIQREFVIEINGLVRQLGSAIEQDESIPQSGDSIKTFADLARRLQHGAAEHRAKELATAMQMETQTIFAQLPELTTKDLAVQRTILLQNPLDPRYDAYWKSRARATALVRGIENPHDTDLPPRSYLIVSRGYAAAALLEEERSRVETIDPPPENYEQLREALEVIEDFLEAASDDIDAIDTNAQAALARRLVDLNVLRMQPEQAIAILNAAEAVKQHNPELFFRLLGISTSYTDGAATESDLFGNPLMIALDQTNRDLETRRAVSAGIAVLRDRMDTLLTVDQHRRPLPFLNEQQIRAAENALQAAVGQGDKNKKPNEFALMMLMQYTPVVELGNLMREVGFERRAEYVDRIRNGTPREILADLMDMPEELLEDPEVIAAWRERYDLDHPDILHRYAMRAVLDFDRAPYASQAEFLVVNEYVSSPMDSGYNDSLVSDKKLKDILRTRKAWLQESREIIFQNRGLFRRFFRISTNEALKILIEDPSLEKDDNTLGTQDRKNKYDYIANTHAFILGLWAHAPKDLYARQFQPATEAGPGKRAVIDEMIDDLERAVSSATEQEVYNEHNSRTFGPLQFALSVLPPEDWMSDADWGQAFDQRDANNPQDALTKNIPNYNIRAMTAVRIPASVLTALATNPYIRPGRLFVSLREAIDRRFTPINKTMFDVRTMTTAVAASRGAQIVQQRVETLRRAGKWYTEADRAACFITEPELLTPIERDVQLVIEERIVTELMNQFLTTDLQFDGLHTAEQPAITMHNLVADIENGFNRLRTIIPVRYHGLMQKALRHVHIEDSLKIKKTEFLKTHPETAGLFDNLITFFQRALSSE